jgi:hypothetical protein
MIASSFRIPLALCGEDRMKTGQLDELARANSQAEN